MKNPIRVPPENEIEPPEEKTKRKRRPRSKVVDFVEPMIVKSRIV
jgi:hypothetical protein